MAWFFLALTALFCWSFSDLFSKLGSKPDDGYSHWKMVTAVGLVMGCHAGYMLMFGGVTVTFSDVLRYLPASAFYIGSMLLGYVGLRYIELSLSSPICNSSGAVSAVLCFFFLQEMPSPVQWLAVGCVTCGMLALGVIEYRETETERDLRQKDAAVKYRKSLLALLLPVLYCILDAMGTFADSVILREENTGTFLDRLFPFPMEENVANVSYELTFLAMGICAAVYVFGIRKEKCTVRRELPKLLGGVFETAGQFAYIFALGDTAHVGYSAAIISSYCALSVVWSRVFLKEKLRWKHYAAILLTFAGIVILGVYDP